MLRLQLLGETPSLLKTCLAICKAADIKIQLTGQDESLIKTDTSTYNTELVFLPYIEIRNGSILWIGTGPIGRNFRIEH